MFWPGSAVSAEVTCACVCAAEFVYKRAVAANPRHANTLANYAYFLEHGKRDRAGALGMYKAALEVLPTHESNLVNYAHLASRDKQFRVVSLRSPCLLLPRPPHPLPLLPSSPPPLTSWLALPWLVLLDLHSPSNSLLTVQGEIEKRCLG
jgi:hypothetical protein